MRLCIPVTEYRGLDSAVSGHFGSAPVFAVVETDSGNCHAISNRNSHDHGSCQPLLSLRGENIEALVVSRIGSNALGKLLESGLRVYMSNSLTVAEAVSAFKAGTLLEATPEAACQHQGNKHCHDS